MAETKQIKKRRVISRENLPIKAPVIETIVLYLLMRDIPWGGWNTVLWTFVISLCVIWWFVALYGWALEVQIDIFERFDTVAKKIVSDDLIRAFSETIKKGKYK
jgi:hypothetical protein